MALNLGLIFVDITARGFEKVKMAINSIKEKVKSINTDNWKKGVQAIGTAFDNVVRSAGILSSSVLGLFGVLAKAGSDGTQTQAWELFTASLQLLSQEIGSLLVPYLIKLTALIIDAIVWIKKIDDTTINTINTWMQWGVTAAIVVAGIVAVNFVLGLLVPAINLAIVSIKLLGLAVTALGTKVAFTTAGISILLGAVALAALWFYEWYTGVDATSEALDGLLGKMKEISGGIMDSLVKKLGIDQLKLPNLRADPLTRLQNQGLERANSATVTPISDIWKKVQESQIASPMKKAVDLIEKLVKSGDKAEGHLRKIAEKNQGSMGGGAAIGFGR